MHSRITFPVAIHVIWAAHRARVHRFTRTRTEKESQHNYEPDQHNRCFSHRSSLLINRERCLGRLQQNQPTLKIASTLVNENYIVTLLRRTSSRYAETTGSSQRLLKNLNIWPGYRTSHRACQEKSSGISVIAPEVASSESPREARLAPFVESLDASYRGRGGQAKGIGGLTP